MTEKERSNYAKLIGILVLGLLALFLAVSSLELDQPLPVPATPVSEVAYPAPRSPTQPGYPAPPTELPTETDVPPTPTVTSTIGVTATLAPTPTPTWPYTVVTVQDGDTISHLALYEYKRATPKYYLWVCEFNDIADCNKIYIGDTIKLPQE